MAVLVGSTFLCATVVSEAEAQFRRGAAAAVIGAGIIGMAIGSAMSHGRHYNGGHSKKRVSKKKRSEESESAKADESAGQQQGDSYATVAQFSLTALGLYNGPQNGKMTKDTQIAIALWQKQKNQEPNGRLTQAQYEELQKTIVVIQQLLAKLDFDPGPSDGIVTPRLREAIQRFQTKVGIQATWFMDHAQANKLVAMAQQKQLNVAMDKVFDKIANAGDVAGHAPGQDTRSVGNLGPQFGPKTPTVPVSFRSLCQDKTVSLSFVVSKPAEVSGNQADEFCFARSQAMDDGSAIFKRLAEQAKTITAEVVRTECTRFAESKRKDIAALAKDEPAAVVARLSKGISKNQQKNQIAIDNAKVCLGFGYTEDKPEVYLGSALFLLGLGQTGYAELVAGDFAVGAGVSKDLGKAVAWLNYAASELEAGKPSAVKGISVQRAKVLQQLSEQLKVSMETTNVGFVGPNFGPKFSLMPDASADQPAAASAEREHAPGTPKYVSALEDSTVFIFTGEGSGTGFFIAPNLILTNDHVVRGYDRVLIASKALPLKVQRGKVLYRGKTTGRTDDRGLDAAIIEVPGYQHPTALTFAAEAPPIGNFVAEGGFPGLSMKSDRGYQDFLTVFTQGGLPSAEQLPHMTVSTGVVQSYFVDAETGRERMQQSAQSAKGNSGSAIVNACGQVVALLDSGSVQSVKEINQQGYVEGSVYIWTFTAKEVTKFLNAIGVSYQTASEPCVASAADGTVH